MAKRIAVLYFSPTNTTKSICTEVAMGMGAKDPMFYNMTLPDCRQEIIKKSISVTENIDHLIVGAPVYSGKLPIQVIDCLKTLNGEGKTCSAIVVYGNRDYGRALHQMAEILSLKGFVILAASAFIGQHSYSDIIPVAIGRPDDSDLKIAHQFGANSLTTSTHLSVNDIPIQTDKISKSDKYTPINPVYVEKQCVECGECSKKCPLGLISSDTGKYFDSTASKQCIGCMSCVRTCENDARINKVNPIVKIIVHKILREASQGRKEPLIVSP
jgi:ferredoxin